MTRSKKKKIAIAVVSTLLLVAAVSIAYWALMSSGEGSSAPTTVGKSAPAGKYTIKPSFAASTVSPTTSTPLTVETVNPGAASDIKKLHYTISVDGEHAGCEAKWFYLNNGGKVQEEYEGTGLSKPIAIPTGTTNITEALGNLRVNMKEEASTDQKACLDAAEGGTGSESAKITVSMTSTP